MTSTAAQGFIEFADGGWAHLYGISTGGVFTDGTEAEMYVRNIGGAQEQLYKSHEGRVITRVAIQVADGSIVTTCILYDAKSGVTFRYRGNERNVNAVSSGNNYDLDIRGLAITVTKGMVIKLNTAD